MDRGEDSGGEHGRRTRRVAGVHRAAGRAREAASRRRARWWVPRSGARAGCRAAARALDVAQRRARWVPRSGARAGCRAAARALGAAQRRWEEATAGAPRTACFFCEIGVY